MSFLSYEDILYLQHQIDIDPVQVYKDLFKEEPLPQQGAVLEEIFVRKVRKVVVSGGFATGKSYFEPRLAMLWIIRWIPYAIVLDTAPSMTQCERIFWAEFEDFYKHRRKSIGGIITGHRWRLKNFPKCYIEAIAPARKATGLSGVKTAFGGFGRHQEHVLVIGDDSQGIDPAIYDAADNATSTGESCQVWFCNPVEQAGILFNLASRENCKHVVVSALDHPNVYAWKRGELAVIPAAVSGAWVDEKVFDHCIPFELYDARGERRQPSPYAFEWWQYPDRKGDIILWEPNTWFIGQVLGQFPPLSEDSLTPIPYAAAYKASQREDIEPNASDKNMGVDVARYGEDETVLAMRWGGLIFNGLDRDFYALNRGQDTEWTKTKVSEALEIWPDLKGFVDEIGVGAGVADHIKAKFAGRGFGVNWAKKATNTEARKIFADLRTQLCAYVAQQFKRGEIAIPDDKLTVEQCATLRYEYTPANQWRLESKDTRRKRLGAAGKSPDRIEGIMYSYAGDILSTKVVIQVLKPQEREEGYRTATRIDEAGSLDKTEERDYNLFKGRGHKTIHLEESEDED